MKTNKNKWLNRNSFGMVQTQEHFSPVALGISQAIRNAFQHLGLGITAFGFLTIYIPRYKISREVS